MCGIAGYDCSAQWAEDRLTPDVSKKIMVDGWLHNLHRGTDSIGFIGHPTDGSKMIAWKKQGRADRILSSKKVKWNSQTYRTLGLHTRQASVGNVSDMRNNHPVSWGKCHAIHNGTLKNADSIKASLSKGKKVGEVDSIAIPMLLSEIDPLDVDAVGRALGLMTGSYAIHVMWEDKPGVSLIARSQTSPLVMAYHAGGCIVYGSEEESVWSIIRNMGLKPDAEGWKWFTLDNSKFVIIENGRPTNFGTVPYITNNQFAQSKETVARLLPPEPDRNQFEIVYKTAGINDFAIKAGPEGRDISLADSKDLGHVYSRLEGFADSKEKFPRPSDINVFSVLSEADWIVEHGIYWHAWFGDIEIIVNKNSRNIVDVYNHALFKTADRWATKETSMSLDTGITVKDTIKEMGWMEFVLKKGTKITRLPKVDFPTYYYIIEEEEARNKKNLPLVTGKVLNPTTNGTTTTGGKAVSTTPDLKDHIYLPPMTGLSWANAWTDTDQHDKARLYFMMDGTCKEHSQNFLFHSNPTNCDIITDAAAYTLSCCEEVDVVNALLGTSQMVKFWDTKTKKCEEGHHIFVGVKYKIVKVGDKRYFEILIQDECVECGQNRKLTNIPVWLESKFSAGEVTRKVNYYAY